MAAAGLDYENSAAITVHGASSAEVHKTSLMQLQQLMLESDGEDGEDYVNQEAFQLHEGGSGGSRPPSTVEKPPLSPTHAAEAVDAPEDAPDSPQYVNQEAIELHMIEALQPWMHGSVDRGETERRLQYAGKTGAFLVRMKGPTGRVFVFSILSDSAKGNVTHNLIEFADPVAGSVMVDNHKLPRPCKSLKSVVKIICHAHNKRLSAEGSKVQLLGVRDRLLELLESTETEWHLASCTRNEAEFKLAKEMPGTFLIRNASDGGECISIRLPQNKMLNVKVDKDAVNGYKVGKCQLPPLVHTIPELARAIIVDVTIIKKTQDVITRLRSLRS
eukprot:m.70641 g.70641  ORF g.70641 m.70641 type:complete len:331 (-) comp18534_c0_seq1:179-1171(-)